VDPGCPLTLAAGEVARMGLRCWNECNWLTKTLIEVAMDTWVACGGGKGVHWVGFPARVSIE